MKSGYRRVFCKLCGRLLQGVFERLPVHTVPRKATSCPYSGRLVEEAAKE